MVKEWYKGLIAKPQIIGVYFLAALILFVTAGNNYLLFHTVVEGFSIIVAVLIYVMATKTYSYSENNLLLFLGNAYFFIALLDFLHLITYEGMAIFTGYGPNVPTQFWIAGRYVEAVSLFLALFFFDRRISFKLLFGIYAAVTALLTASIMWFPVFPDCFIEGQGLTGFKIASEYIICFLIAAAILRLKVLQEQFNHPFYQVIIISMSVSILSELSFTLYNDVYGVMNILGHILKIVSYYLIYYFVIHRGLKEPYDVIFYKLKTSALFDYLTELYNREGFIEAAGKELARARVEGRPAGILLMDLDKFKLINDRYGHLTGDKVLKSFAEILRLSIGKNNTACRLGGDEFVVFINGNRENVENTAQQIRDKVQEWINSSKIVREMGLSIGSALWEPGQPEDMELLIREADRKMYLEKETKSQENKKSRK